MFWESLPDAISTNFNTHSLVTVFESFRLSHYLYDFVTISMMFARAYSTIVLVIIPTTQNAKHLHV